jgi:hypothetical protein
MSRRIAFLPGPVPIPFFGIDEPPNPCVQAIPARNGSFRGIALAFRFKRPDARMPEPPPVSQRFFIHFAEKPGF